MRASAKDLRFHSKNLLDVVSRGEEVIITYRGKSAMREVSKVLSLPEEAIERFSRLFARGDFPNTLELKEQLLQ